MSRDLRALQHSKNIAAGIKEGQPALSSFGADGITQVWYIPGKGLYLVTRYKSRLYYKQFDESV